MKKKYIVSVMEAHAHEFEVFAESQKEAKEKVQDDKGVPILKKDSFCYLLPLLEWRVRLSRK